MTALYAARESVLALVIERFVDQFDFSSIDSAQRGMALREVAMLRPTISGNNPRLAAALKRFEDRLRFAKSKGSRKSGGSRRLNRMLRWLVPLAIGAAGVTLSATPAFAAIPVYTVGGTITNPQTGGTETVVALIGTYSVQTDQNRVILLAQTVGDTYSITTVTAGVSSTTTYKVTAYTAGASGASPTVTLEAKTGDTTTTSTVSVVQAATLPAIGGGTGSGSSFPFPSAAGDVNQYIDIRQGGNGGNGRNGGGVCFGALGCIQYAPGNGGAGGTGPTINDVIAASWGLITTISDHAPGIVVVSNGGNGGNGGFGVGNIPPAGGGAGGNGGSVTATNYTTVVTTGERSYGMLVQSSAGRAGAGGNCYVACSGGGGGAPGSGGNATGTNAGNISTTGTNAAGLIVQSLGGSAGTGGDSYGIVGSAGAGGYGGNAGEAHAFNNGVISTAGAGAYGVLAQSVGGIGGNSGSAGGLVAFGGSGGGAGSGSTAEAGAGTGSSTITGGNFAHGIFAQSVGGGGGAGGASGGLVSFGASAGSAGAGGLAKISVANGAYVKTGGTGAFGLYAQSVGGMGGTASGTGGIFTMGGTGGSGGAGGEVQLTSGGTVVTTGLDSRGVFAQSVGGGGGTANASGGIVSLGGSGGGGGTGATATVTLTSTSSITTGGIGADGVYVQSIGGGGGSGASSGGVVALGGSGAGGGAGGTVSVSNAGTISTAQRYSRGIFAQSVGGGGGSGGDSGGLVAIGGGGSVASVGGTVTVGNSGTIATLGNMSTALQAQSIGGGGGDGGTSGGVLLSIGGSGDGGGGGGQVTTNLSGVLSTAGNDSTGLFAQSVGGGGGNGGSSTSVSAFVGLALGGSGAGAGGGGNVTSNFTQRSILVGSNSVLVDPLVTTVGDRSRGVYLQSVGGGGGNGGMAVQVSAGLFAAASFAIGGSAGGGGEGGIVNANGDVSITTGGDFSEGFFAQSVGGGGGTGGAAVAVAASVGEGVSAALSIGIGGSGGTGGKGGAVTVASGGSIVTGGSYSSGFVAQSVGGGGGTGGFSVSVAGAASDGIAVSGGLGIGGSGGTGGVGGTVNATFNGDIATGGVDGLGSSSLGALIQSIGGGGGAGGFNVSATIALGGGTAVGAAVGLGGTGGSGGIGGAATGVIGGDVVTRGARSTGILIQSAGGGGGSGGFNVSGNIGAGGATAVGIAVGLGGSGGGGGAGGTVYGTANGTVDTYGVQSDGVVIQSVGGGGGSGGFNVSGNLQFAGAAAVAVGFGLGGSGGGAGAGGYVDGEVTDAVVTRGNQSRGVLVQSVGGGGGAGGFNVTGGFTAGGTVGATIGVGLGGTAGGGGSANLVFADARSITTYGNDSGGFIAQSVGGGGGVGGFSVTGSLAFGGTAGGTIGIGLGGSGGSGGSAMKVTAGLTGIAATGGDRSGAILAQSVGGGGGAGSFNITGGIAGAGTGAGSLNIGLGGTGGTAGHAGEVELTVNGYAITDGFNSDGIVAQSVGGGGGSGGFNISAGIAAAGTGAGQVGFGMGGRGGGGGNSERVTLNVNNGVTTSDLTRVAAYTQQGSSAGIIAQSLGGGGGNGGFNVTGGASFAGTGAGGVNVGIGGSGGTGGHASEVIADISGYTVTLGNDSVGVLAQSIGGGGGNGAFNVSGGLTIGGTGSGMVNVGVGGSGGTGSIAGDATLRINDNIGTPGQALVAAVTGGDRSDGIVVQSIGGGGGNGGFNVTGSVNIGGTGTGAANIGVGGMGGSGAAAGNATADVTGGIATLGEGSTALLVQSIGGGGGNGGFNVSGTLSVAKNAGALGVGIGGFGGGGEAAGTAFLNLNQRTNDAADTLAAVSTADIDSHGIIVQSLGGGGGNGGFNVTSGMSFAMGGAGNIGVGVGGFGGLGGNASTATANVRGDIVTLGDRSNALLVQSLGGGGGNGGFNVTSGITASKGANGNLGIGIGGFGGDGGDGKDVFATIDSDIRTSGDQSYGATIQSVGGGGGNGGFNVTGSISATFGAGASGNLGIGVGGFGGDGGSAGEVTATLTGDITTTGFNSHGILVQSAGGGGGSGGFNVTGSISASKGANGSIGIGIGGFGGDGGHGNIVRASLTGDVATTDNESFGVSFQSLGGGGGNGAFNVTTGINISLGAGAAGNLNVGIGGFGGGAGHGGKVIGEVIGDVHTTGDNSHGILMQSIGGGGGNGGLNVTGGIAFSKGVSGTVGFGMGGFGGGGGNAELVDGLAIGDVTTSGTNSFGAIFQSLGGAGGLGGLNVSGGISITKGSAASGSASIGIGGFGGGGGSSLGVKAEAHGLYITDGKGSSGVVAQSIGGGGGAGGLNISGQIGVSTAGNGGGAALGLGGFGGDGGTSGNVTLLRVGQTVTRQALSNGVVAQSVGGGGGLGGFNVSAGIAGSNTGNSGTVVIGIGGFGGGGGKAGDVTATVVDSVWALGSEERIVTFPFALLFGLENESPLLSQTYHINGSHGILVQSVGGGGGSGGMNISGGISLAKQEEGSKGSALVMGLGGFGGAGGDAGIVTATIGAASGDRIQVQGEGDSKSAVYVASIGGGGGDGGFNISGAIATDGQIVTGIGGFGGAGGLGKLVTATVDADLFANGTYASGLTVQSLGGGGGFGGFNLSGGLKPREGDDPVIVFGMGGDGGKGNSSGDVIVDQDGQVVVNGRNSNGVLVQSIAGGGGSGGMNITAVLNRSDGESQMDGFAAGIGIGGSGGVGGVAGNVTLRSTGNVLINTVVTNTAGGPVLSAGPITGFSQGVTAQSIGGGGGTGGFNFVGVIAPKGNPLTIAVGGSGGVGGNAGTVSLDRGYNEDGSVNGSLINTFGDGSTGLTAQSIGGGGGNAGTNLSFSLGSTTANKTGFGGLFMIGGDGASSGNGTTVDVRHFGSIQTNGIGSDGLLAQSIGKGGGNAALNVGFTKLGESGDSKSSTVNGFAMALGGAAGDAGSAGKVTVDHDGSIFTHQSMSSGIVAQSLAGGGGNTALNMAMMIGADNILKMSIGREGGRGGTAGDVDVTAAGLLVTEGKMSNGIVAQSIGGAGGLSGSITVEGQLRQGSGADATKSGLGVSVGLEGGASGRSGAVTVDNDADIQTNGESARGIVAQSIGGDGGIAGSARIITTGQANSAAVAVGGGGGAGSISGKVIVGNTGLIVTKGVTSDGILAQSIGGGGGVGGSASTIKAATGGLENKSASTIAVAVGGSGGDGAVAGDVEVTNDGIISTENDTSYGIRAQSIGGGGGVGGATYNIQQQKAGTINTFNLLVGGGGGSGQLAGRVDVFNNGIIQTTGAGASGISANSIGGGGGDAGSVSSLSILQAQSEGKTNSLALAIGGGGGSGGKGAAVNVVNAPVNGIANSGTIITTGLNAHGIFAQSLGGGGGNGSSILSIAGSTGAKDSISIGLNIGGGGGDGNTGGEVTVDNSGFIRTQGDGGIGILAQSIGGGGGNGGLVLSANILWKSKDKSPLISIGGIGGAGNDGGHVSVVNSGSILTEGKNADGIVAQSIGGGGGNAGMGIALTGDLKTLVASNLMALLVGAIGGGNSGVGGQVDVVHTGDITVLGEGSQAIVAESINGGGGHISFDMSGISMPTVAGVLPDVAIPDLGELDGIPNLVKGEPTNRPVNPVIVAARVGASDAASMNGGKVNISISGTMNAAGDYASGTTVRSVGGGGGAITLSGSLVTPAAPATPTGITTSAVEPVSAQAIYVVALGAKNSDNSSGADIDSNHSGQILTTGKGSFGVLLQSIGGGGGSALVNLQTDDFAIIDSLRLGLGAVGTSGSDGGSITRTQTGAVFTTKDLAHGALVQSIGGGGGSAIAHVGLIAPTPITSSSIDNGQRVAGWRDLASIGPAAVPAAVPAAIVSLGATGGSGNDGGAIDLDFSGGFMTTGARANGLVVQSIGAGGGEIILDGLQAATIILGGQAGANGSGGNVTIRNDGQIVTLGEAANGILLQSIGGGGGALFGGGANPTLTLSTANSGNGGAVLLSQDGDIFALGDRATGLIAQSIGGGGGFLDGVFVGTAGGVGLGGAIGLDLDGGITAYGFNSTAVMAQSLGSLGGGNITIDATGNVRGGSGTGAGIALAGGANNVVTIESSLSAVSGRAMTGTYGNDRLENEGLTIGNILLGGGNNLVHTAAGATFLTIDTLDLRDGVGSTGLFDNDGTLLMGLAASRVPIDLLNGETFAAPVITNAKTDLLVGTSVISQVALDGNFRQSASGLMYYDVAFGPYASDRINATGSAVVDGTADITLTWLENNDDVTLIATGAGGTDLGLDPLDTIAIDYGIRANSAGIHLTLATDFAQDFLNYNQRQIGLNLDSAVDVGGASGIGRLLALIGNLTAGQEQAYADIFAELDPESLLAPAIEQLDSARDFGSSVMDCRTLDERGAKCIVTRVDAHRMKRSGGEMDMDYGTSARLRFGGAVATGNGWRVGGSLGVSDGADISADNGRTSITGNLGVHAGLGVGKAFADGRGDATLALSVGTQTFKTARFQNIFDPGVGHATIRTRYFGANANVGYTFSSGALFATPSINLQAVNLKVGHFAERGLDGTGARSEGRSDWYLSATPTMTAGLKLDGVKLSGSVGYQIANKGSIIAPMRLIGSPDASDPAMIRTLIDKETLVVGLNADVKLGKGAELQFGVKGHYGDKVDSESANVKLLLRF